MDPKIKIVKVSTFGKADHIRMPSTRKGISEAHVLFATRILYYGLYFIPSYEREDILMIEALLENGKMVSLLLLLIWGLQGSVFYEVFVCVVHAHVPVFL